MNVGVIVRLSENIEEEIKKVHDFGMKTCQLNCWDMAIEDFINKCDPDTVGAGNRF